MKVVDGSGNVITDTTNIGHINPIRFKGYYYDKETELFYIESRYYDPEVTRFISPDSTKLLNVSQKTFLDKNLYTYCDNNPVTYVDRSGKCPTFVIGAFLGAFVNVISNGLSNSMCDNEFFDGVLGAFIGGAVSGAMTSSVAVLGYVSFGGSALVASRVCIAANYIGAFTEAVVNETVSYIEGKEINDANLHESTKNILVDTVVNGTVSTALDNCYEVETFKVTGEVVTLNNDFDNIMWGVTVFFFSLFTGASYEETKRQLMNS